MGSVHGIGFWCRMHRRRTTKRRCRALASDVCPVATQLAVATRQRNSGASASGQSNARNATVRHKRGNLPAGCISHLHDQATIFHARCCTIQQPLLDWECVSATNRSARGMRQYSHHQCARFWGYCGRVELGHRSCLDRDCLYLL